ncbi:MAG: type II toxin-antitoxin system Phd/YefM family antitoxin [Alphaproteobacteria bacterium]
MMQNIGAFEAKTHFSELLRQVEAGDAITITRHGRPVARLVAWDADLDIKSQEEKTIKAVSALRAFPRPPLPEGMTARDVIASGRKSP